MTTETLNFWPLVMILEDTYYPERVSLLLDAVRRIDEATFDAARACDGYVAEIDALLRQN